MSDFNQIQGTANKSSALSEIIRDVNIDNLISHVIYDSSMPSILILYPLHILWTWHSH